MPFVELAQGKQSTQAHWGRKRYVAAVELNGKRGGPSIAEKKKTGLRKKGKAHKRSHLKTLREPSQGWGLRERRRKRAPSEQNRLRRRGNIGNPGSGTVERKKRSDH